MKCNKCGKEMSFENTTSRGFDIGLCEECEWDKPADLPEAGASAERISSVIRSNATTGWISVKERLPEINIPVLAIIPDVHYPAYAFRANNADEYMVYYTGGVKRCNTVTHWMPLPEPPEV